MDADASKFHISCLYSVECQINNIRIMQEGTPIGEALNLGTMRYSIAAQRDAVASAERQRDEERRSEISIVVGALSTTAVIFGVFFGFFGVNAKQVNSEYSLFDRHYVAFYLLIAGLVLSLFGLLLSLRIRRHIRASSQRNEH